MEGALAGLWLVSEGRARDGVCSALIRVHGAGLPVRLSVVYVCAVFFVVVL